MNNINYGEYEGFNVLSAQQASEILDPQIQKAASFDAVLIEIKKDGYEYFYITEFFKRRMSDGEYYSGRVPQDAFDDSHRDRTSKNYYIYVPLKYIQSEKEIKGFNFAVETANQHVVKKNESLMNMQKVAAAFMEAHDIKKELVVWKGKDANRNYAYGKVITSDYYHILLKSYEAADKFYTRVVSRTHMKRGIEHENMEQILSFENDVKIDWIQAKDGRGIIPYIRNNERTNQRVAIAEKEMQLTQASEELETGFRNEVFLADVLNTAENLNQKKKSLTLLEDVLGIDLGPRTPNTDLFNDAVAAIVKDMNDEELAQDEERRLKEAQRLSFDNKRVENAKALERNGSGRSM